MQNSPMLVVGLALPAGDRPSSTPCDPCAESPAVALQVHPGVVGLQHVVESQVRGLSTACIGRPFCPRHEGPDHCTWPLMAAMRAPRNMDCPRTRWP